MSKLVTNKSMNMKQFKMSITNGKTFAPAMIVNANDENDAVKIAKNMSGLGSFKSWNFEAIEMKTNKSI